MGSISSDSFKAGPYSSVPLEEEEEEEEEDEEEKEEEEALLMRTKVGDDYYVDLVKEESEEVAEFKPIEHPIEPLEEDQPTECPNPTLDSSILSVREIAMMLSYFN